MGTVGDKDLPLPPPRPPTLSRNKQTGIYKHIYRTYRNEQKNPKQLVVFTDLQISTEGLNIQYEPSL